MCIVIGILRRLDANLTATGSVARTALANVIAFGATLAAVSWSFAVVPVHGFRTKIFEKLLIS